jgi:hypothetical protein
MIDGYRCYQAMSDLEQRRWQRLVVYRVNFMLNKQWNTFEDFIVNSFTWSETKEGHEYWDGISKKYVLHDILSPQKKLGKNFWDKPPNIL